MTHFINLAPDAKAVETIARSFRENIDQAGQKINRIEALLKDVEAGTGEYEMHLSADLNDIAEGLYLIINAEEKRIESLQDGLDACELAIEANELIRKLNAERDFAYSVQNNYQMGDFFNHAVAVIAKIAEKAGMKA
jgi:hypothetical protein